MNFFRELKKGVDKLNDWGNATHQPNWTGQADPLTQLIRTCTYPDKYLTHHQVSNIRSKNQYGRL